MADYHKHLETINEGLAAALGRLIDLKAAMAKIEKAGMYPAMPIEQWQRREGKGQYLYMLFRKNADGTYQGPDGKRKVYIGADPAQIAEARRLAENRRRWAAMDWDRRDLERWLDLHQIKLQNLAERCERWPEGELLGPADAGDRMASGPNGEG